jgi:hypothetical protein
MVWHNCKIRCFIICTFHRIFLQSSSQRNGISRACKEHKGKGITTRFFRECLRGISSSMWEGGKTILKRTILRRGDCIPWARGRDQWRVVLNTATNPGLPTKTRNPSTRYATTAFPTPHSYLVNALHYCFFLSVCYYLKTSLVYSNISNNFSSLQKVNSHSGCQGILTLVYQLNI